MPVNGRSWGFNVSEGGLEPPYRCDFPGSGKSCNKSNTSGVNEPRYSATCSLFILLSGLRMAEAVSFGPSLLHRRLQPRDYCSSWVVRAGPNYRP
jgi:hypothetical protein